LGAPPAWVASIPFGGDKIAAEWNSLAAGGPEALAETLRPYARAVTSWLIAITGGFGGMLMHFLITVLIAGILYARGELGAQGVMAFARRIGGDRAANLVVLAGQSVRSVALGVVVTALVQSALVGLGLWVCGVPRPGLLTALVFVLCIAQIGPILVIVPAIIWMYSTGDYVWATVLLIWGIPTGLLDNFLRPVLISRGVDLPMLLIIAGVIGGLIGFGIIGLFIGPVILAVTYASLSAWIADQRTTK
jgi:predicted PurR-regulated permease PerM